MKVKQKTRGSVVSKEKEDAPGPLCYISIIFYEKGDEALEKGFPEVMEAPSLETFRVRQEGIYLSVFFPRKLEQMVIKGHFQLK